MTFWIILVVLCLAAIAFVAWPLYRRTERFTPLLAAVIVLTAVLSAGLYQQVGNPGIPSGRAGQDAHGMNEAIESLQARLANEPDDIGGWKMLGRSYMSIQNYGGAVTAFEKAMELESGQNAQTLVDLAMALLQRDQTDIVGRPAGLLESALALDPNNPAALFYGGAGAANRGDTETAASRWEILLGLNPPAELLPVLNQRIAEWRGQPLPTPQAPAPAQMAQAAPPGDAVVVARVSLSEQAQAAMQSDAPVFVIARDPAQPSPPIAVVRRRLSELPADIALGDGQSMVAGRELSAFQEFELVARVSLSGGPGATSGDWFGSLIVKPAESDSVSLTIDKQVP